MIRVNLLPIKQSRRREAGRNQLIIAMLVVLVELVVFVVLYSHAMTEVDEQRNQNQLVQRQVESLEKEVKDHQGILDEISEYERRQLSIDKLQSARIGPVYLLLELSNILSQGGKPHLDEQQYQEMVRLDPMSGLNENWDVRRVWLSQFKESDRQVTISGDALSHEDVAELLRRINLSNFFVSSELISTTLGKPKLEMPGLSPDSVPPVVHFELTGKIQYR